MSNDEFKELCEKMELNELGENLRTGLEVLHSKLCDEGFNSDMMIVGNLEGSYPEIIILEAPNANGTAYRETFTLG